MPPQAEAPGLVLGVFGYSGRLGGAITASAAAAGIPVSLQVSRRGAVETAVPTVVVDASSRDGSRAAAAYCLKHRLPLLELVSSLGEAELAALRRLAEVRAVLRAVNLARLHDVQLRLAETLAEVAGALGAEVTVLDRHPATKADRPSGTARRLSEVLGAGGRPVTVESARYGLPVSDHTIVVTAGQEVLTVTHSVVSLNGVADRCLGLARRLQAQPAGLWSTGDVERGPSGPGPDGGGTR